jgi:hypothetical protein
MILFHFIRCYVSPEVEKALLNNLTLTLCRITVSFALCMIVMIQCVSEWKVTQLVKELSAFIELDGLLWCSQKSVIEPYPEPVESIPQPHTLFP